MDTVEQIFDKIMKANSWNKQQFAKQAGMDSTILSQKLGTQWNAHWRVFVKLLPLMVRLGIITHEQLYGVSDKMESQNDDRECANSQETEENLPEKPPPITVIMSPFGMLCFT